MFLLIPCNSFGQEIDLVHFNKKYLEHAIKIKIDSIRKLHNCAPLYNDSILYLAASHHSRYMNEKQKLTHFEKLEKHKTPQNRANYFGAINYSVGENVLETPIHSTIKNKKGKLFNTKNYLGLANSIVDAWVNSPGHFKNIITSEYQITGLSISINLRSNMLYACQKFASVLYKNDFKESKTLFSYSDLKPKKRVNNFKGIPTKLLNHKHKWNLEHNDLSKCINCNALTKTPPLFTLKINKKGYFILRIENSEYVKKLMNNKNDGFAVEIVEYNDYVCKNSAYYTKPSRRNGQCKLNGKTLKPVLRKQLYKGYKKRREKKDVHFLSYIIGADSISFFKRFYGYKLNRFSSKYFEIKLGKKPTDVNGLWAYNLVYIQDNQICHIDYFTHYCGEEFSDYFSPKYITPDTNYNYIFKEDTINASFIIPFEKNKANYTISDIKPFLNTISDNSITIDSLHIIAFSSIEGDSISNQTLQKKRANSIVSALRKSQKQTIKSHIEIKNSWDHFYKSLRKSKKWHFLAGKEQDELLALVNKKYTDSLEFILSKERKALINLNATINLTDNNLAYYIHKRNIALCDSVSKINQTDDKIKSFISKLDTLYGFAYKMVVLDKISITELASFKLPDYYNQNIELTEKFILYGMKYSSEYNNNSYWKNNHKTIRTQLIKNHVKDVSAIFIYNDCVRKTVELAEKPSTTQENIQEVFNELEYLKYFYNKSRINAFNVELLSFDLNFMLANTVYPKDKKANADDAQKSILQMYKFYKKNNLYNYDKALKLSKLAVLYNNTNLANSLLEHYTTEDSVLAYKLPLNYQHSSVRLSEKYYQYLIKMSSKMNINTWCNLFFRECGIPFQAFDHDELRNVFCEKCKEKNLFLNELMKGKSR